MVFSTSWMTYRNSDCFCGFPEKVLAYTCSWVSLTAVVHLSEEEFGFSGQWQCGLLWGTHESDSIPVKKNCSHSLLKGKGCQEFRFFSCEGAAPVQYLLTSYHCNSEEAWVLWSSKVKYPKCWLFVSSCCKQELMNLKAQLFAIHSVLLYSQGSMVTLELFDLWTSGFLFLCLFTIAEWAVGFEFPLKNEQ